MSPYMLFSYFFFFNDTATTEIYTLSLHDALPICRKAFSGRSVQGWTRSPARWASATSAVGAALAPCTTGIDRKSTRLNSSHQIISYAVFCLKKKKTEK